MKRNVATWVIIVTFVFQCFAQQQKVNLLFIVTDEHNFRTLGCYRDQLAKDQAEVWGPGNVVETPNIDKIAEHGVLFNRMYASAPVCTPARASMFTGRYGHQLGMPNNSTKEGDGKYLHANIPTIAEVLSNAGYVTGYAGKWHLAEHEEPDEVWEPHPVGSPDHNYGFQDNRYMFNGGHDKFRGMDDEGNPYFANKHPKKIGLDEYGQPIYEDSRSKNVKSTTDWLTDRTLDFISEHKDEPFYYVLSIPDPHTPDVVRAPYDTMYTHMNFQFPRTYSAPRPEGTPSWQKPDGKAKVLMKAVPQYFGMVKNIDDNVGRILQKLEDEKVLENTIIVFTADHGDLMGEHARMNKGTVHEASAKVPFVMAHGFKGGNPIIPRNKVIQQAGNTCDWMPTFLSLLGEQCPRVSGRDLSPLFNKKTAKKWNDITFCQLWFSAAIDSRYKLRVARNEKPWLMDIEADPDEITNFFDDSKYEDVKKRLAKELLIYNEKYNDSNKFIEEQIKKILK